MKHTRNLIMLLLLGFGARQALAQDQPPPPPPPTAQPPADATAQRQRNPERRAWQRERNQRQTPRRGGEGFRPGMGREGRPGGMAGSGPGFLERLRREDPEEFERLSKLYREDRQAFMQEARKLARQRGGNIMRGRGGPGGRTSPEEQKCLELSRLYLKAANDDDKAAIRQELETAVQHAFEVRLESSRQRIAKLEAQLDQFREHIKTLEENRDQICKGRVDELTRPPELKWEGNW